MKRRIVSVGVVTVLALIINLVWFSSVFDVRTVKVLGTKRTTIAQVRAAGGLVARTPRGRVATPAAYAHLGLPTPGDH